ncbi:MAG: hypothetical protein CUN55_05340 [Phototrophicales bacterium]|nr:MAG: hypothetical protein CUN55_05340 [Phototrophicales bacterium]
MFSVDRKRRERIKAKRAIRQQDQDASEMQMKKMTASEGHVKPASGRTARQRRRKLRKEARESAAQTKPVESASWLATVLSDNLVLKPRRLRERRAIRQRERERRKGLDKPETRVRPMGVIWISWRWLSGTISLFLSVVLYILLATDTFVINEIAVGGERYVSPEWVFEATGVAGRNLFLLDAKDIEARLERNPSIADAQVYVSWPPNEVSVIISEREPVLIWEQGGFRVWIDINGIVMFQRQERDDLLRIVHLGEDEEPLGVGSTIDQDIITGALQLQRKLPSIKVLLYDPIKGLGFRDERNWRAWFGVGTDMERRLLVYEQIIRTNYPAIQFSEIDVSDADYPYFVSRFTD